MQNLCSFSDKNWDICTLIYGSRYLISKLKIQAYDKTDWQPPILSRIFLKSNQFTHVILLFPRPSISKEVYIGFFGWERVVAAVETR